MAEGFLDTDRTSETDVISANIALKMYQEVTPPMTVRLHFERCHSKILESYILQRNSFSTTGHFELLSI